MRGRVVGPGVLGLLVVAMSAVLCAPAASAACPNEAFRAGPSALLAECRAYEQVTPVDKESGVGISEYGFVKVSSTGGGIYFSSTSAFAGAQSNTQQNAYISARSPDSWSTQFVGAPQSIRLFALIHTAYAVSDDLGLALVGSEEALTPGAIAGGSNLYLLDTRGGVATLVAALPSSDAFKREWSNVGGAPPFVDAATDWSDILIPSPRALTPEGIEGQPNLYEYREGRLRLAVAEASPAGVNETTPNVMSTDGNRFFYVKEGLLYLHRSGRETLLVSEDEEGAQLPGSIFVGATPDDGIAFFQNLGALYRFEAAAAPGRRITEITPPIGPQKEPAGVQIAAVGEEDGTTVYFTSPRLLTSGAEPREESGSPLGNGYDIYAWHGEPGQLGEIRYIGKSEVSAEFGGLPAQGISVSADGRYFGFESEGKVTPEAIDGSAEECPAAYGGEPAGRCVNVFLYSLDTAKVSCASCNGSPSLKGARLGGRAARPPGNEGTLIPRSVLDDGSIFFDTRAALVPRDANGVLDAYGWREGQVQLISTGTSPSPSGFIDASADGTDVFFQTQQPLVGQDIDSSVDLYDARVDGGLPQGSPTPTPPCTSETSCRAAIAPTSPPAMPASGAQGNAGACLALQTQTREAKRRSRALAHRAKKAKGKHAAALRRAAKREAKLGAQLGRKAGNCTGGGR